MRSFDSVFNLQYAIIPLTVKSTYVYRVFLLYLLENYIRYLRFLKNLTNSNKLILRFTKFNGNYIKIVSRVPLLRNFNFQSS